LTVYQLAYIIASQKDREEEARMKMITVRIPESLHSELLDEAKREGVSLNQLCLTKLARPLDWYRQKTKEIEEKEV
jgi:predicted HicB family RNase H-like nuclease